MEDFYTEQLVKKKTEMRDIVVKTCLILLTVLSVFLIFVTPFGILAPVILAVVDVFVFRYLDVEFEYLYVNGSLDIDKIMHKERRRNVFSAEIEDMEVLAPSGSRELLAYQNVRPEDFTSRMSGRDVYEMIFTAGGRKRRVIFEPNEKLLEGIRMRSPRKVVGK